MAERIAVVGLGYVGLPVALAFARHFPGTVGFDTDARRIDELRSGVDRTLAVGEAELAETALRVSTAPEDLQGATFFVVTVPTPVDDQHRPDLSLVRAAAETVGRALTPGAVVVFESTVYPGVTAEVCGPILAAASGLEQGADFKLGYSPERINPGDAEHRLERVVKVVAGEDAATLDRVADCYGRIVDAGVFRASSIEVAEAAKVIENTQRDLNIALMNELSILFARLGIPTADVLAAAGTKWNFLPFHPGLVGGHCIGVDPYYLTARAEAVGYQPEVILAGRRINDGMGRYVARRVIRALSRAGVAGRDARIGVLGLTFKEDIPDVRNSKVPDLVEELREFGAEVLVHDPLADPDVARAEWGLDLSPLASFDSLHGVVLAVPHRAYHDVDVPQMVRAGGVLFDVKSVIPHVPDHLVYEAL